MHKTYVLGILDGWGVAPPSQYNAVSMAKTDRYNMLLQKYPHSLLSASGAAVGLPDGQMGNSEVGHLSIGSGRVIYQDLPRINNAIENGEFSRRLQKIKQYHLDYPGSRCHVIGLISDGGVHSHINHIMAACDALGDTPKVLHAITDGRDTAPRCCLQHIKAIESAGIYIASISGRYYAMDRDKRWDRIALSYNAMFFAEGPNFDECEQWISNAYETDDIGDEFIRPAVHSGYEGVRPGDTILMVNFRADRVRQLLQELTQGNRMPAYAKIFGMVHYSDELEGKIETLFPPEKVKNTIGEVLSNDGKRQLRLAETEKYAHVTYFFNGGRELPFAGEERVLIASPKVATYDLCPEMSIFELTAKIINAIASKEYDFICFNFANADMVGHTGNISATIKAIEAIDRCLGEIYKAAVNGDAEMIITADHGNAEYMYNADTSQPHTAHTMNKVPLLYIGKRDIKLQDGVLADIAPTILQLMGIPQPKEMSGRSLIGSEI